MSKKENYKLAKTTWNAILKTNRDKWKYYKDIYGIGISLAIKNNINEQLKNTEECYMCIEHPDCSDCPLHTFVVYNNEEKLICNDSYRSTIYGFWVNAKSYKEFKILSKIIYDAIPDVEE